MKLLLIILAIYTSVYGNNSIPYSNSHNIYSSIPVEQTYRGIGYSTNYSNGQFNSKVYKSSMTTLEYQNRVFTGTYNPGSTSTTTGRPGPMKSAERPYSGGTFEDFIDWLRMNTDPNWPSYVDPDYWDWFLENYGDEYGEYVEQWFDIHPDAQNNLFKTPIGDTIVPLLILLLLYMFYDLFIRHTLKK